MKLSLGGLIRERGGRLVKRLPLRSLRLARLKAKADAILFDWSKPLTGGLGGRSWEVIRAEAKEGPRVLIATTVGGNLATLQFDTLLAAALTLRGASVEFLLCDAALPACMMAQHDWYPDRERFVRQGSLGDICKVCHPVGEAYLKPLGLPVRRLSEMAGPRAAEIAAEAARGVTLSQAQAFRFRDLPVGEHALAGALRFHARGDLDGVPQGEAVFAAYLRAGCIAALAAERIEADIVVAHHGIYIPQGLWVAAARRDGRRVVTWNPGYRRNCFVFSEDETYHRTMITEDPHIWDQRKLSAAEENRLTRYLDNRREGADDWIAFGSGQDSSFAQSLKRLGLDPAKPTIVLLTSVNWDARLHYESNAFEHQLAWLDRAIELFKGRADLNLAIRIHPAELTGNIRSEQKAVDHIFTQHGRLPDHIAVVAPENPMNTYALTDGADAVLIYSTKTGIELAARGMPVVVAGEAWIRGKGFSIDAGSKEDFDDIIASLPLHRRLSTGEQERARLYADHFFFRRMIALPGFSARDGWPPYRTDIDTLDALAPSANPNLDLVCERILAGGPFIAVTD